MNETLSSYLHSFLHPWKTQEVLKHQREYIEEVKNLSPLELVEEREEKLPTSDDINISFEQSLSISWLFVIFNTIYSLIGMFMGLNLYESVSLPGSIIPMGQTYIGFTTIFFIILRVVFFPLIFWFYGKFWINIIKMFGNLYEKEEDVEEVAQEIVTHAFTTHTFLVIPIVGLFLHRISNIIYLFGGLRKNLGLSVMQALLVILCPLIIVLFATFMMFLSFGMMISGL
ncbi:MAG: hypothetical protein NXH75_02690 [Halobacteriovoraceae bacterium]|nr:hypothetical protein [Halobacteriovoraceae bacterium]